MEHLHLDEGGVFEDEEAILCNLKNHFEFEQTDKLDYTVSELAAQFEKLDNTLSLMLDVEHEDNNERCHVNSCPCGNELRFPRYNIPMNLRSSWFSFRDQRRRSINNVGDFIVECSSTTGAGDVILCPSAKWIFDSIEGNVKAGALLESSLLLQLGVFDGKNSKGISGSANTELIKSSDSGNSLAPRKNSGEGNSELNLSERKIVCCTNINSACSNQSCSSTDFSISKGLLYCAWKNGLPYFIFSFGNDCGEAYVASPVKVDSSTDKALNYVYVFRSRTDNKRDSRRQCNNTSSIIGKMKVSSSLVLHSNNRAMETEFVLFGCQGDYSKEMQSSSSTSRKSKGLSKKVAKLFRSTHSFKHHSIRKERNYQFDDFMRETFMCELEDLNEINKVDHLAEDFPPNLELAAIVVKDQENNSKKEASIGGWGLKFLDKGQVTNSDTSQNSTHSCAIGEGNCKLATQRMNVLIPSGFHGGPIQRVGGPSTLTEKWRSGGHCDCGGWDVGCPLRVLENNSRCSKLSLAEESDESNLFSLFIQGKELGEPTLRMVGKSEDMHVIYFQTTLSALQSFSIAIAIIHTKSPDLYPKL